MKIEAMQKTIVTALFTALSATATLAQNAVHCTEISAAGERLKCFDHAYSLTPVSSQSEQGDWHLQTEQSRLDDSTTVYLSTDSIEVLPGRYGRGEKALLMLRCKEGRTDAYIYLGGYFMSDSDGGGVIDYRVDDHQANNIEMAQSSSNDALGLWSSDYAIPFIKELYDGKELFVRARPYKDPPVEMTFRVEGVEVALRPLRDACGWQ